MTVGIPIWNIFRVSNLFQISADFDLIKRFLGKLIWKNCDQIG
jgi:hypothetical protein